MVVSVSVFYPYDGVAEFTLAGCPAQHHESKVLHITNLRKGQKSKFKVQFLLNPYCFHTIVVLKNHKSTQVEAICI